VRRGTGFCRGYPRGLGERLDQWLYFPRAVSIEQIEVTIPVRHKGRGERHHYARGDASVAKDRVISARPIRPFPSVNDGWIELGVCHGGLSQNGRSARVRERE